MGFLANDRDLIFQEINYACAGSKAQVCQTLVSNVVNAPKDTLKYRNILMTVNQPNAKEQCNCMMKAISANEKKHKWHVIVSTNKYGYNLETLVFTMPEGTQFEREAYSA